MLPFSLGVAAAILVHLVLSGWWLNSGRGVAVMATVLFVLGAVVARSFRASWLRAATALAAGAVAGSAAILFWTGPGNIWPIVLAFVVCISAGAVFIGSAVANAVR